MKSEVTAMPMIAVRLSNDAGDTDALNLSPVVARVLRDRLNEALAAFEKPAASSPTPTPPTLPEGFLPWPESAVPEGLKPDDEVLVSFEVSAIDPDPTTHFPISLHSTKWPERRQIFGYKPGKEA